jgi:hypothetical protein
MGCKKLHTAIVLELNKNTLVKTLTSNKSKKSVRKDYMFGFNGQEKVNEIAGVGNHNTALFWEYDTRLGRRWNVDPVKDHSQSSYASFNSNPIFNTDRLGNVGEPVVKDGQLIIYSHILFYGGAATVELANKAANNIQTQWTSANGTVTFKGKEYNNVQFVVTAEVVSEKTAQFRAESNQGDNYNPRINFARIESKGEVGNIANQFAGESLGGDNSMYLLAEDIVDGNTSQSHEMGHTFGISKHFEDRHCGIPRIMNTINTKVDKQYSVDGKDGGRLNTNCRQVTQADMSAMKQSTYKKGVGSGFRVGNSSNKLFNKNSIVKEATGTTIDKKTEAN